MNENHSVFWSCAPFSSINFGFKKQRLWWISFEWHLCRLLRKVFHLIFWLLLVAQTTQGVCSQGKLKALHSMQKVLQICDFVGLFQNECWKSLLQLFFSFTWLPGFRISFYSLNIILGKFLCKLNEQSVKLQGILEFYSKIQVFITKGKQFSHILILLLFISSAIYISPLAYFVFKDNLSFTFCYQ